MTQGTDSVEELTSAFTKIGLVKEKASETAKSAKLGPSLASLLKMGQVFESGCEKSVGNLFYKLASSIKDENLMVYAETLVQAIVDGRFKSVKQIDTSLSYLTSNFIKTGKRFEVSQDLAGLETACGVGIVVTSERIKERIDELVNVQFKDELLEKRYAAVISVQKHVQTDPELKWAEQRDVIQVFNDAIKELLGEKTADDCKKPSKKKTESSSNAPLESLPTTSTTLDSEEEWKFEGDVLRFHKPGENPQLNEEIRKRHLSVTGGRVVTRFPPEPNGFLHIGHAKAINFDFRYAEQHGGICYLRYDDTNPEAEEERYFHAIRDNVHWLGFTPYKITHSSDYFDQLYSYAVELIKRDKAYVCHMTPKEIMVSRGGEDRKGPRSDSPWRTRSVAENLAEFEKMRTGHYEEGQAVLRMKMDMENPNPNMWDLVAYRIIKHPHVRTLDKWIIYPSYDFCHPLCDSLENVTHSFCTVEFEQNREGYYWLCDALEVYKPVQWEMGRLQINNTVLSKRKLMKLVQLGHVNGWDDPRLFTMDGVRRRGITPAAINEFVRRLGITKADAKINPLLLEACVRDDLNKTAARVMGIEDPIRVVILDYPAGQYEDVEIPYFPSNPEVGSYKAPFGRVIYIDASDYMDGGDVPNNYYRLAPGKTVGLLHVKYNLTCTIDEPKRDEKTGKIIEITALCDMKTDDPHGSNVNPNPSNTGVKPRARIHWIADCPKRDSPIHCELRIINPLFKSEVVPGGDDFLTDLRDDSMVIKKNAMVDLGVRYCNANIEDRFQFVRTGFFCVDRDSVIDPEGDPRKNRYVFNRTVTLKENSSKPKDT